MKKILVIDDDEIFRRVLRQTLLAAGYSVVDAENGAAALKLFEAGMFDLIITDLIMPEKEGFETIIALRRLQRDLKIIAISGGGRVDANDYLPMARHLGATYTLVKPFTIKEIRFAVSNALEEVDLCESCA